MILVTVLAIDARATDYYGDVCATAPWNNPNALGDKTLFCDTVGGASDVGNDGTDHYYPPIEHEDTGLKFSARMLYSWDEADDGDFTDGDDLEWDPTQHRRCVDGTEPFFYIDLADAPSNNWILYFEGGRSCYPSAETDEAATGMCDEDYLDDGFAPEMSSDQHTRTKGFGGILSALAGNPFSDYNRVWMSKCGYDRHMGSNSNGTWNVLPAPNDDIAVRQQGGYIGLRIAELLDDPDFAFLDCSTYDAGGNCVLEDDVPELCIGEGTDQTILLVGHSTGAHALMQMADGIVERLKEDFGCDEDDTYIAILDGHFMPMLEGECREDVGGACTAPAIYSGDVSGTSSQAIFNANFFADVTSPSPRRAEMDDWDATLTMDSSCLSAHGGGPLAPCYDQLHVLANHLTTPFFLRESYWDVNPEHNSQSTEGGLLDLGFNAPWSVFNDTSMANEDWNFGSPRHWWRTSIQGFDTGDPSLDSPLDAEYGKRVHAQADEITAQRYLGVHPEAAPDSLVVGLDCWMHSGVDNTTPFANAQINEGTPKKVYADTTGYGVSYLEEFIADVVANPGTVGPTFVDGAERSESGAATDFCWSGASGYRSPE